MRSGAAAEHRGLLHETAYYSSNDEFLALVVPFLQGGVEAGEPTIAALHAGNTELVRAEMRDTSKISFVDDPGVRPASVIKAYQQVLAALTTDGAQQIRLLGDIPPAEGLPWEWWARYEAAVNHIFADFPLWALCPYDTRITPDDVLTDVARTHPQVATADGRHVPNAAFEDPTGFLIRRSDAGADPLEAAPPMIELVDPTPAAARRAVRDASRASCLDTIEIEELVLAVSEAVTNGQCYGQPPVCLRLWSGLDRLVATVTDRGQGPADPFVGLLPTTNSSSAGLGLWLTHQMCSHVTLGRDERGFTIRVVAGIPRLCA